MGSTQKYYPFGSARSGSLPNTDKKFTGQRLDDTGLYYYGARYYDAGIGRFISADIIISDSVNPQALNRYSYVINNPVRFTDPTGNFGPVVIAGIVIGVKELVVLEAAATTALMVYYNNVSNILETRSSNPYINNLPQPDFSMPTPTSQNPMPGGWKKPVEVLTKIILGTVVVSKITELIGPSRSDAPQLPLRKDEPLPTTPNTLGAGGTPYVPGAPTPIGDTGFTNWGTTPSGAQVISKNEPSTYSPEDWWAYP